MNGEKKWYVVAGIVTILLIGIISGVVILLKHNGSSNANRPILDENERITFVEKSINNDTIKVDKSTQTNVFEVKELDGLQVFYNDTQVTVEDMEYQNYKDFSLAVLHEDGTFWYTPNSLAFEHSGKVRLAIQTDKPTEVKILRN